MKRKTALLSLGCKVNSYETEYIREDMIASGFEIVDFSEAADVYIINTCSVTNIADRKSRQMLHKAKALNPDALIVATGCYVQTRKEEELKTDADMIIGNNHKGEVAKKICEYFKLQDDIKAEINVSDEPIDTSTAYVDDIATEKLVEDFSIYDYPERSRAFIRIEDGCNQFCSYCIIPYARGRVRSRSEEEIVEEVKSLADKGFKEIVLSGIHISSYGYDNYEQTLRSFMMAKNEDVPDETVPNATFGEPLLKLIKKLSVIPGIDRIRLGSLEPRIITEAFIQELSKLSNVCPHFHLSLQSGCDTVLKRMNRHYTGAEFLEKCELIRKYYDAPSITTDVIVGFPGETEEEFEESCELLEKVRFSKIHIFKYSRRAGTVADRMPGQLTDKQKHERSLKVQALEEKTGEDYIKNFVGKTVKILVEEATSFVFKGLTERYVPVEAKLSPEAIKTGTKVPAINDIIEVFITGTGKERTLLGEIR
ncbi:MAG: MiaB/RimO family radical SAM methylthiotransferase [Lachnospiraceae bacterium]|nr:MiaB/RimO family radical SAM methylthiotransferase [Lachnospiraceae bacterium]